MPFLQELQCGSGYYEPKNFVSTLPVNQTCAFQQVQHPVPYQPNGAFHFDHYSIQSFNLPLPQPSFYYTTTAGPSLHPVHQNTLPLEDTLRAESEDGPHQASGKTRTANKRGRPTKNPVWTHFHRLNDKHVQCNMCGKLVKSACATNMRKHMERHHGDDISGTPDGVLEANFYGYSKSSQLEDTVSHTNGQLPQTMWKCNNQKRKRRTKHPVRT